MEIVDILKKLRCSYLCFHTYKICVLYINRIYSQNLSDICMNIIGQYVAMTSKGQWMSSASEENIFQL